MPKELSDRCPICNNSIPYTEQATEILCPFCGHSFPVVEFISERKKMEQALADSEQAQEKLKTAEAEKAALQARLNGTLSALTSIESSQDASDKKLADILSGMKADRQTYQAMMDLLSAVQKDQQSGQDALSQLLRALMKKQSGAADKLAVVQELSAQILHAQQSGGKAVERMQDEVLERIEALDMKFREKVALSAKFSEWSRAMQKADVQRLERLQSSSDTLLQGQKAMSDKLDRLSDSIDQTRNAVHEGFDELRKQRLDTLIELYDQATKFQNAREFDRAEERYLNLLAEGGADAQDAAIYWRLLLCHYGVEYQKEKGKTIPIILRPDLTDPSTMQVRKDLFAHIKNDKLKAYYTEWLNKIDSYLDRYREVRLKPEWKFDVFISVKQTDANGQQTLDSKSAIRLYQYFIQDPALEAMKLRVFNSQITSLPAVDEFEPYIITALMSAKVLIVVGSTPEYMNSQWVKNEWSRFQYLQKREQRQGKNDRLLCCYVTGGMDPKNLPVALNPNREALTDGPMLGSKLREIIRKAFPNRTPPAPIPAPIPAPGPAPSERPEAIAKRMKVWLTLSQYQQVTDQFANIQKTRAEILLEEPWLCLHALCAQRRVRTIEALAKQGADLRRDGLYILAYESADASLRAKLDALWATATPREEPFNKPREITYPDGKYVGQAVNGKRHGKGLYIWANGDKYDGEWFDDQFSGQGIMTWKDGRNYNGQWKNGKRHGKGVYEKANGEWCEGEWVNDKLVTATAANTRATQAIPTKRPQAAAKRDPRLMGLTTISAGYRHTVGLKKDGTVVAVGENYDGQLNVSGWENIVAVSAGGSHTVGLKEDGTVVAVGMNAIGFYQCNVSDWKNIIAVSAGANSTVGLKEDGTVVALVENQAYERNISGWKNIVAISLSSYYTVGLKADGTVVAAGDNEYGQCGVSGWKNIIAVSAGHEHTVGLKADGTVVAVGNNQYGQCNVSGWKNIVAISAGSFYTIGLKEDGTVVAVGSISYGKCDVSDWKNIVAISTGLDYTVGLKADGTVVAVGDNQMKQCNVSDWADIRVPDWAKNAQTPHEKPVTPRQAVPAAVSAKPQELTFPDGRYVGLAINGKRHGKGVHYYINGDRYEGEWKDNKRNGQGVLYYSEKNEKEHTKYPRIKYDGEWTDDWFNGNGVLYYADGDKYDGEWKEGLRCGKGVDYYPNGNRYEGDWKAGLCAGKGVMYYANGDRYDGDWKDGLRAGKGVMYYANGDRYEGDWKDGKRTGKGAMYYADGDKFEGEWRESKRTGKGVLTFDDGSRYEGDFVDNHYQGRGVYTWPSGNKYDGEWKNSKGNGKGVYTWSNGDRYEGDFVDGLQCGRGVKTWANGNKYDGEWKNGKRNGKGIFTCPDGDRYEGDFVDGCYQGRGVYIWPDGRKYDGQWQNDDRTGKGIFTFPDGTRYVGNFLNNRFHGRGVKTMGNGDKYDGEWKNGLYDGKGVYTWSDGDRYEGDFVHDKKHGRGVYTWPDGRKYDGQWQNDKRHGKGIMYNNDGTKTEGEWMDGKLVTSTQVSKPAEPSAQKTEDLNTFAKYISALTEYVRQNGNKRLTDAQIQDFITIHRLKRWDIGAVQVKKDLADVYTNLKTPQVSTGKTEDLYTFEQYFSALTECVRKNKNKRLTDEQIQDFITIHRLHRWDIGPIEVKKDLADIYARLKTPWESSGQAGKSSAASRASTKPNPPAETKKALTKSAALDFWRGQLPGINGNALLLPQLTQSQINEAQNDLGIPMERNDQNVLGVIHVQHGLLLKSNTVLIVTPEMLYINANNRKKSPPKAVPLRNIKRAEATELSVRKHQLEIIMNSGESMIFSSPESSAFDTLNFEALAKAINQFIHLFKL